MELLQTEEFAHWLGRLRDRAARARILVRLRRIELTGNVGDSKAVGESVYELRVDYGPGYRLYYARRGEALILLLIGGDKSSQKRGVVRAQNLNREYGGML